MEYQKIMNFLDNTRIQPTKFRSRNWDEIFFLVIAIQKCLLKELGQLETLQLQRQQQ